MPVIEACATVAVGLKLVTRSVSNRHCFLTNIRRHDEICGLAPITSLLLSIIVSPTLTAFAAPKTSLAPTLSVSGIPGAGRLGSSLDCAPPSTATNQHSLLAIGAPAGLSDTQQPVGLVYIVDPEAPLERRVLQTIGSPSPRVDGEFGKALAFIPDNNGDGVPELAISQPNGVNGTLYFFKSVVSDTGQISYASCGSFSSVPQFGEVLTAIDSPLSGAPDLLVGSPRAAIPHAMGLTVSTSGATCYASEVPGFAAQGTSQSYLGAATSFIADHPSSGDGIPDMVVGVPRSGGASGLAGRVRLVRSDEVGAPVTPTAVSTATPSATHAPNSSIQYLLSGEGTDLAGASIASSRDSDVFAAGSPGAAQGRGLVSLVSASVGTLCAFTETFQESSVGLGQTVASLGSSFSALTGLSGTNVAAYHSEPSTGGAVAVFGMSQDATSCSQRLTYINNCEAEPAQEQGAAIQGGARCAMHANGSLQSMVVVGSPGHSGGGRVDIYLDTNTLPSQPLPCGARPVDVATPPLPTAPPKQETPPRADASPSPTQTPTSPPSATNVTEVFPDYEDLPPPQINDSGRGAVAVTLPKVSSIFTGNHYDDAIRKLRRAGFSQSQAENAMRRIIATYVITFTPLAESVTTMSKKAAAIKSSRPTVIRVRSRRNRISTRLLPGKSYMVTYTVEFSVNKPKTVRLGATKPSAPTRVRVKN